ncbi:MAG: hypothetical protein QJR03_09150, partial [Sphaerobacter sp.]|nr:hypothetical protein [Sphaerobacter sp.]
QHVLREGGHEVSWARTIDEVRRVAASSAPDAVLVQIGAGQVDLRALRETLRRAGYAGRVIAVGPGGRDRGGC